MSFSEGTIGAVLVGVWLNTFLYGLVTYQFAAYYKTKFNDPPAIKYMVVFLFILDTFHSVSVIYMAWSYITTSYDSRDAAIVVRWPYAFTPVGTALAGFITQMFQGHRIWRFTGSKTLYGIISLLAIPSFILATICSVETWTITLFSEQSRITALVIAWLSMQAAVDTFITVTLTIVLSRSRIGFPRTDRVLDQLIRCAIQTGLFAVLFCMTDLIAFVALPGTSFYGVFAVPIGRIYTNTLLDNLLIRESLKAEMATSPITTLDVALRFRESRPSNSPEDEHPAQSAREFSGEV